MAKCAGCTGICSCVLTVTDTASVDLTLTGTGAALTPWVLSATAAVSGGGEVDVFVAASNTSAARKALADFVCTGVADQVVIQAAIDFLGVGVGNIGGRVFLMEGDFNTTATIQMKSGVSLFGLGRADGATTINFVGATYAIENAGFDGLELANLYVHLLKCQSVSQVNLLRLKLSIG